MKSKGKKRSLGNQSSKRATRFPIGSKSAGWHSFWNSVWFWAGLLVALVVVAYLPSRNGDFIWDDDVYIVKNQLLVAPDGLRRIWFSLESPSQYFPLVYTSFRLEFALWGLNPTGYHWTNLLLHAANTVLVWRVLAYLKIPGAWWAAAIFGIHPVQVESVAWITERKNVLMGFFYLLTLLAWLKSIAGKPQRQWLFYSLALLFYALALSAKTTACTLPVAMILILWLRRDSMTVKQLGKIIPFVLLGVAMGLISMWWERFHIGTRGARFDLGWVERGLIASRGIWFYLWKLVLPVNLSFFYPKWEIDPKVLIAYIWLLAALAAVAVVYYLRRLVGRGVEVALFYFVATLSPLLGFVMLYTFRYSYVADHYQYLACIGPIALLSACCVSLARRLNLGRYYRVAGACALLAVLGFLTWRQNIMYGNAELLWRTTITRNPQCGIAYNNLGNIQYRKGEIDEATASYLRAEAIAPLDGEIHYNLGAAYLLKKQMNESIAQSRRALELDPELTEAHYNLGNAYFGRGEFREAISSYREALRARPRNAIAHSNLAICLVATGSVEDGLAEFNEALRVDPASAEVHYNFGYILVQIGRKPEGEAQLREALRLRPGYEQAIKQLRRLGAADGLL